MFFIGSCFAENIGNKLLSNKYNVDINPFGVLYNPISVKNSIDILLDNYNFVDKDLNYNNNLWFSFMHHSKFSDINKEKCLSNINNQIKSSIEFLKKTKYIFITFGTAWVYKHIAFDKIVSNCHKYPSKIFERYLLDVDTITQDYIELIARLKNYNPDIEIFFTLSPVRHWQDGATGNLISKSILIMAIDRILNKTQKSHYFPAYEIVMDELRDYRFYEKDMLHINNIGIEYIWEKFSDAYINKDTKEIQKEIQKIINATKHKSFNVNSDNHQKFVHTNIESINKLKSKYKYLNFDKEVKHFNSQLNTNK